MKLYINGDSHSCGAETYGGYTFAKDDPNYAHLSDLAHPKCLELSWGYLLARTLNAGFFCDAVSASSNDRILRRTYDYIKKDANNFILIGWSTWEREEWLVDGTYYQVSGGGKDTVPNECQDRYKQWVIDQTQDAINEKMRIWHGKIWDLHVELQERNIQHLFFNAWSWFDTRYLIEKDWSNCYLDPYSKTGTYWQWCADNGFKTVNPDSFHYGVDAQKAWAKYLLPRLTNTQNNSNIVRVATNIYKSDR
jgi:hypothetical protein